jgi:SAM-dependent methyltransferase
MVPRGARVLDLACGRGRHARLFALQGARVTALDRDEAALAALRQVQGVTAQVCDVEAEPWPFEAGAFDAIVVTNYLHRPLFPQILASLAPAGVLLYETFMLGNEKFGRPSNPAFLLRSNELLQVLGDGFQVVAFEQGLRGGAAQAVVQRLCAIKGPDKAFSLS